MDYLEAHGRARSWGPDRGSGSVVGVREGRDPERPLLIGSVKTNIGHLEAAAGVAGVIKVLLAMREGVIPEHLHFERPNPRMDWERLPVRVTSEATAWPESSDRPVRAAVSSFGFSGTNAHMVLEGYGAAPGSRGTAVAVSTEFETQVSERDCRLLPLSGRTSAALTALAGLIWAGWGRTSGRRRSCRTSRGRRGRGGATSGTGRGWCSGMRRSFGRSWRRWRRRG